MGFAIALMPIEFATQILECANRVVVISVRGKELALALGAGCHCRDLVFVPHYSEVRLSLGRDSQVCFHGLHQ
jgi:hypothetical protein